MRIVSMRIFVGMAQSATPATHEDKLNYLTITIQKRLPESNLFYR